MLKPGNILLLCVSLSVLVACSGEQVQEEVVVSYKDKKLTRVQLAALTPEGVTGQDSIQFAEAAIQEWISNQAISDYALTADPSIADRIAARVDDFRAELIKQEYHAKLLQDSLKATVSSGDVADFIQSHAKELVAEEPLFSYIYISTANEDLDDAAALLDNLNPENLVKLQQWARENALESKVDSTYTGGGAVHEISKGYLGELSNSPVGKVIRWTGVIQGQRRRYLFKMLDVVDAGEPLPISLSGERVQQEVLNQRKNELIRRADQRILDQAMRNNDVQRK